MTHYFTMDFSATLTCLGSLGFYTFMARSSPLGLLLCYGSLNNRGFLTLNDSLGFDGFLRLSDSLYSVGFV